MPSKQTEHEEQKDELEAAFHRPEYVYREPADSRKRIEALQQLQASQYLINQFYGYCLEHKERFQHRAYSGSESRERECRSKARQLFGMVLGLVGCFSSVFVDFFTVLHVATTFFNRQQGSTRGFESHP